MTRISLFIIVTATVVGEFLINSLEENPVIAYEKAKNLISKQQKI